ncbi:MAG: hypothetical protein ACK5RO_03590 [Pseudobdellovibrionaceae bacterium]|jgi:hypothetical protein
MKSLARLLIGISMANLFALQASAKEEALIRLRLNTTSTYEQVSSNELRGLLNSIELFIDVEGKNENGEQMNETLGPISASEVNIESLTLDKNSVTSQSQASGRQTFRAKISDSSIFISRDEILRVSAQTLKEKGQSLMTQFNIQSTDAQAELSLDVADMNCERKAVTTCKSAVNFSIKASR